MTPRGRTGLAILVASALLSVVVAAVAAGWRPVAVGSASMAPALRAGDLLLVHREPARIGDVVVYRRADRPSSTVVHRVVAAAPDHTLTTRGDSNPTADVAPVSPDAVVGVVKFRLPLLGRPVLLGPGYLGWWLLAFAAGVLLLLSRPGRGRSAAGIGGLAAAVLVASSVTALGAYSSVAGDAGGGSSIATGTGHTYDQEVQADNPYLYWRLDEASGATAADSSGNGRTGLYQGAVTYRAGGPGALRNDADQSVRLDGGTGYATSTTTDTDPTTLSVEVWFRTGSSSGGLLIGLGTSQTGDSAQYDRRIYMHDDGTISFGIYHPATSTMVVATSGIGYNDNEWHHAVGTLGTTNGVALYVDGAPVASVPYASPEPYTGYWRIGYDRAGGWPSAPSSSFFNGYLDEAAVYHTELGADRVAGHYDAQVRAETYRQVVTKDRPWLYYPLDESGGTVAADRSGNGRDGTFQTGYTLGAHGAITDSSDPAVTLAADGAISNGTSMNNPTALTVEAWIRTTTAVGQIVGFSSDITGPSWAHDRKLYMTTTGQLSFGVFTGVVAEVATSPGRYDDGRWHHVAATFGPGGMVLYVDGGRVAGNPNTIVDPFTGYWRVGTEKLWGWPTSGDPDPVLSSTVGDVDEVAVYTSVLSAAQIRAHADAGGVDRLERQVLADAPTGYWRFGDAAGTTAANRGSSTVTGSLDAGAGFVTTALVERRNDTALHCDGSGGVAFGDNFDTIGTSPFSLTMWVRPTAAPDTTKAILGKESPAGPRNGFVLRHDAATVAFERYLNDTPVVVGTGVPLRLNVWQQLAVTYDGSELRIYSDGTLKNSVSTTTGLTDNAGVFRVCDWAANQRFAGDVDELAWFGTALTAPQVSQQFAAGLGL